MQSPVWAPGLRGTRWKLPWTSTSAQECISRCTQGMRWSGPNRTLPTTPDGWLSNGSASRRCPRICKCAVAASPSGSPWMGPSLLCSPIIGAPRLTPAPPAPAPAPAPPARAHPPGCTTRTRTTQTRGGAPANTRTRGQVGGRRPVWGRRPGRRPVATCCRWIPAPRPAPSPTPCPPCTQRRWGGRRSRCTTAARSARGTGARNRCASATWTAWTCL
mmetsp:Transcript_45425/g.92816  ORF Transcript_45425/g.92816 Transcript_45425/m.92816 type:complete len:217 (+) Transcript_45425:1325-1975(+)